MVTKAETLPPVGRDSRGLREALFDEMDAIRNGKSSATRANAMAKLVSVTVETVRMELDVHRYLGAAMSSNDALSKDLLPKAIPLGG